MEINRFIESTNLSPTVTGKAIDNLVAEAIKYSFLGVCVPPFWVKRAAREIDNRELQLVTVIGYPLGYQMTETKMKECEIALLDGANELDVVMNLSAFNDGMSWVKVEVAKLAQLVHSADATIKIILETELWEEDKMIQALEIIADAGADFAKTSTGYHRNPVNIKTIQFMRKHLPSSVGIKASGGITDSTQARMLLEAGADRIGTSKAVQIVT